MRGLFITGTDTDVGKTFISSLILKSLCNDGYRVGAYKPACSGAIRHAEDHDAIWEDRTILAEALAEKFPLDWICPQCFQAPLAPPVAAARENNSVDEKLLYSGLNVWNNHVDGLIIEGVGGWKCPISETITIENFAAQLRYPVLIIASQKLGVINHTLLTIDAVRASGLNVAGVILNDASSSDRAFTASNADEILRFVEIPFLAVTQYQHREELRCWKTNRVIELWSLLDESARSMQP